jgi:uncharacterized protein (TIGR02147 family)
MRPITEFVDYRAWLRAWMAERPKQRTQRELARRLEVASSLVSMVLSGKRNLTVDQAAAWGRALRLAADDHAHWVAMVRAAHGGEVERREAALELRARRAFARARRMPVEQDVFAAWHTWAILELARCPGFVADAAWIAAEIRPRIDVDDAARALEALIEAGFVERTPEGARAAGGPVVIPDATDPLRIERLKSLHRDQLAYAATVMDQPRELRHVVSIMFAASKQALPLVKERLGQAIREAVESAGDEHPLDQVFQVSLQIVPRSEGSR